MFSALHCVVDTVDEPCRLTCGLLHRVLDQLANVSCRKAHTSLFCVYLYVTISGVGTVVSVPDWVAGSFLLVRVYVACCRPRIGPVSTLVSYVNELASK